MRYVIVMASGVQIPVQGDPSADEVVRFQGLIGADSGPRLRIGSPATVVDSRHVVGLWPVPDGADLFQWLRVTGAASTRPEYVGGGGFLPGGWSWE